MGSRQYFVYILSSRRSILYTGVTKDLEHRISQHREAATPGFTSKYQITRLVYFEITDDVYQALAREKQIKAWSRKEKLDLIRTINPRFKNLAEDLNERLPVNRSPLDPLTP